MFKKHTLDISAPAPGITVFDLRSPTGDGKKNTVTQRVIFTVLRDLITDDPADIPGRRYFDTTLVRGDFGTWTFTNVAPDGGFRSPGYLLEKMQQSGGSVGPFQASKWEAVVDAWQEVDQRIAEQGLKIPEFRDRLDSFLDSCVEEFPGFVDDSEVSATDLLDKISYDLKNELEDASKRVYPNGLPSEGGGE